MTMKSSTIKPGLLVVLRTSIVGNVKYERVDIETGRRIDKKAVRSKWETTKTVFDPEEATQAQIARGKARYCVSSVCAQTSFGLLCPRDRIPLLDKAYEAAKEIVAAFNQTAKSSRIDLNMLTGKVAQDDKEAIAAINAEMRELIETMAAGVERLDPRLVRDAANKARAAASMLSVDAKAAIQETITLARDAAKAIVAAGETAAAEIDASLAETVRAGRFAFLDMDAGESPAIGRPAAMPRGGLDLPPAASPSPAPSPAKRPRKARAAKAAPAAPSAPSPAQSPAADPAPLAPPAAPPAAPAAPARDIEI